MRPRDRAYHVEMLLGTLAKLPVPSPTGDTRNYLDVDMGEKAILQELLGAELTRLLKEAA